MEETSVSLTEKKRKAGIVYLSSIPPGLNVAKLRDLLSQYGQVGRIYLEPDKKGKKAFKKFTEGWVEYKKKRVAKQVAELLNNTQVGGKKKTRYYDAIWNIKYLPRFKWTHLHERLAYEKALHEQRMRTEIAQAKRETNYYIATLEKSKRFLKRKGEGTDTKLMEFSQNMTEDDFIKKKKQKNEEDDHAPDRDDILKSIFAG